MTPAQRGDLIRHQAASPFAAAARAEELVGLSAAFAKSALLLLGFQNGKRAIADCPLQPVAPAGQGQATKAQDDVFKKGIEALDDEEWAAAVKYFQEAIRLDHKYILAHHNLARALHDQKKLDEAVTEYLKVIELDPNNAPAHNNLGNALRRTGKPEEARARLAHALSKRKLEIGFGCFLLIVCVRFVVSLIP